MRRNEASRAQPLGKMSPALEGPYKVIEANHDSAYTLETMEGRKFTRTWNARNLTKFNF